MKLGIGQPKIALDGNILDIEVPKEMENAIPTGHPHIDILFAGDGVIAGTVCLVTGVPGAGKTTLMLQLADRLSKIGHKCIVNTGEESLYQVRRVTKRLGLKTGFIPGYDRSAQDIIRHCESIKKKYPKQHLFLVIDSLQCLELDNEADENGKKRRGRPLGKDGQQIRALEMLTEYCKNNWVVLFLIGHVNKKGEFAGKQTIKHVVDCHLHLSYDFEAEDRRCEMQKNRFGVAGQYYGFDLTAKGLIFESETANVGDNAGEADE